MYSKNEPTTTQRIIEALAVVFGTALFYLVLCFT